MYKCYVSEDALFQDSNRKAKEERIGVRSLKINHNYFIPRYSFLIGIININNCILPFDLNTILQYYCSLPKQIKYLNEAIDSH